MPNKYRMLTIAAASGLMLYSALTMGLLTGNVTTIISPLPLPLALFAFFGYLYFLTPLFPFFAYLIWGQQLLRGVPQVPTRTVVAYLCTLVLSPMGFVYGWHYGIKYQGLIYTRSTAELSFVFAAVIGVLLFTSRKRPSFYLSQAIHFLLFAWLVSYAFPYLGELP